MGRAGDELMVRRYGVPEVAQRRPKRLRALLCAAVLATFGVACSTTNTTPVDAGSDAGSDDLGPCTSSRDCQRNFPPNPTFVCIFDSTKGCSAQGHCYTAAESSCRDGAVDVYACNCADGGRASTTECGIPPGYSIDVPTYACTFPDAGPPDTGPADARALDASDASDAPSD